MADHDSSCNIPTYLLPLPDYILQNTATSLATSDLPSTTKPRLAEAEPSSLGAKIAGMKGKFKCLVQLMQDSFIRQTHISLKGIKESLKNIPLTRKIQLGEHFEEKGYMLLIASTIEQFFFQASFFWDYLNPGLLNFLVTEFGSTDDKMQMTGYCSDLKIFRSSVKLCDFVKDVSYTDDDYLILYQYKKLITVMSDSEKITLEDAERFKIELLSECQLPQAYITRVREKRSSIAIVFYLPNKMDLNIDELKPLFHRNGVIKVYWDEVWTMVESPELVSWKNAAVQN